MISTRQYGKLVINVYIQILGWILLHLILQYKPLRTFVQVHETPTASSLGVRPKSKACARTSESSGFSGMLPL